MPILSKPEITEALSDLTLPWEMSEDGSSLVCTIEQPNFMSGFELLTRITVYAEAAQHHPDVTLSYGAVTIMLTTHDAGGVTEKDLELARQIDTTAATT